MKAKFDAKKRIILKEQPQRNCVMFYLKRRKNIHLLALNNFSGKYQNCHLVLKGSFWFFLVLFLVLLSSFFGSLVLFQFYINSSNSLRNYKNLKIRVF